MPRKKNRPTLEEHVEIGQAIKDVENAIKKLIDVSCGFLLKTESGKITDFDRKLMKIKSDLEDVMFQDFPYLTNDAISVYYHHDEQANADDLIALAKEAGGYDRNYFGGAINPNGKKYEL